MTMTPPADPTLTPDPQLDNPIPPAPFDPNNLPPDVAAFVDRARSEASKTARKNALKDAATDPDIVASIRKQLEQEANMGAEERVAREREALERREAEIARKENSITATAALVGQGIDRETATELVGFLTTADETSTNANVEAFTKAFTASVEAKVEAVKNELLANGSAPKTGGGGKGTEQGYRDAHKAALEAGKTADAIAIQRKALAEGFSI